MSEYTPNEQEIAAAYVRDSARIIVRDGALTDEKVEVSDAEARRGIAKLKADALRVAAIGITTQVENAEAREAELNRVPGPYYHGASYGMRKTAQWLHRRADRIEGAINE